MDCFVPRSMWNIQLNDGVQLNYKNWEPVPIGQEVAIASKDGITNKRGKVDIVNYRDDTVNLARGRMILFGDDEKRAITNPEDENMFVISRYPIDGCEKDYRLFGLVFHRYTVNPAVEGDLAVNFTRVLRHFQH